MRRVILRAANFTVIGEGATPVTQSCGHARGGDVALGTHERGMIIDRIAMSTDPALTEGGFNAIPNSDVDIFVQPSGATTSPSGGDTEGQLERSLHRAGAAWCSEPTNDGGQRTRCSTSSLRQGSTLPPMPSYVDYRLQFATPGSYRLYTLESRRVWASGDRLP
jgi:hypothetical protein